MAGYVGRFAPSPSGPLHLGSLVAALGSYLDARAHQGQWLLRIEDIDPPREVVGAADAILRTLDAYGLHWDGPVRYQHQHHQDYDKCLATLAQQQLSYRCSCTRKQLKAQGLHQRSRCHYHGGPAALRFRNDASHSHFTDRRLGLVAVDRQLSHEDFIIHRKDGLYAYQLAVVADDIDQGVTHVVRGSDLVDATVWQLALYDAFAAPHCQYLHLPLVRDEHGNKLSKQNHATAICDNQPLPALHQALAILGLDELQAGSVEELLAQAVERWPWSE